MLLSRVFTTQRRCFSSQVGSNVLIVGSGGLACLVASVLSSAGTNVSFISDWKEQTQAILNQGGVKRHNLDGTVSFHKATVLCENATSNLFDSAFVGLKAHNTPRAIDIIRNSVIPGGLIFTLQNGLQGAEMLQKELGKDYKIIVGCTTSGATVKEVGAVHWNGKGWTKFGTLCGNNVKTGKDLVELFNSQNFTSKFDENIEQILWSKLAINAAINPLVTLLNEPNGILLEEKNKEKNQKIMTTIIEEVVETARLTKNIDLNTIDLMEKTNEVIKNTKNNINSMLHDRRRGVTTEIESLNGYIAKNNINAIMNKKYTEKILNSEMKIISSVKEICELRNKTRNKIAFVPFLGGLHDAHMTLVDEGLKNGDEVWCSLFLNKLQFNNENDYTSYPYSMEDDLSKLRKKGVRVVFAPTMKEMYPVDEIYDFPPRIIFPNISEKTREGKVRPGHFDGMGTVVTKLFAFLRPDVSIFGEKDFVQSVLVHKIRDEFFPTMELIVYPTVREHDGLAESTRNRRLEGKERENAPFIYKTLLEVKKNIENGETNVEKLIQLGMTFAEKNGLQIEYISLTNGFNAREILDEIDVKEISKINISIGGSVGISTRLIDNIMVEI